MKFQLLCVGKTDDATYSQLILDYKNRINHYVSFDMEIIADIKRSKNLSVTEQRNCEGNQILKQFKNDDFVILMDENGKSFDSVGFSEYLDKKMMQIYKRIVFVIGGPYGFSKQVYERANEKIALSKMTFTHQMVRLIFVEQLYRSMTILNNEPYHHK